MMMPQSVFLALLIAGAVCADAMSVAILRGGVATEDRNARGQVALRLAILESAALVAGWFVGHIVARSNASVVPWVGAIVLGVPAATMLYEAFGPDRDTSIRSLPTSVKTGFGISLALSWSTFVIGIGAGLIRAEPVFAVCLTALTSVAAAYVGWRIGKRGVSGRRIMLGVGACLLFAAIGALFR